MCCKAAIIFAANFVKAALKDTPKNFGKAIDLEILPLSVRACDIILIVP
jgi:hypothetical protein